MWRIKSSIILIIGLFLSFHLSCEAKTYNEKYYQNKWCGKWNGKQEVRLNDGARVDCVTKTYAVEFDFAKKWAEGYGQAVYYSEMTKKEPAVIIIIENPSDWKYYNRIKKICTKNKVTLWYMLSPNYDKDKSSKNKTKKVNDTNYIINELLKILGF